MLSGARLLVPGVVTVDSVAFAVARRALLSPAARATTGTVLQVDAGHAATAAPLRRVGA